MTKTEATAEVFFTAFMALDEEERGEFLSRLVREESLRQDLIDLGVFEATKDEPTIPLEEYLENRKAT
jgi:hypothetical protein